ncbi:MAG TPA: phosphatase PAP2 family protein [Prolixibacteraceae bacterium]|jgi:hypothetical protein
MKITLIIHPISRGLIFVLFLFLAALNGHAESEKDTLVFRNFRDTVKIQKAQIVILDSGDSMLYFKPKHFQFIKNAPLDIYLLGKTSFSKKNLPKLGVVLAATGILMAFDQPITNAAQQFGRYINLDTDHGKTKSLVKIGGTTVLEVPTSVNNSIYFLGEGWPSLLVAAGFYTYGLTANNYRALQTTSQMTEMFLTMGITTQILKRLTGRETPFVAMDPSESQKNGGVWHLFPNPKIYQKHVSKYDAFPSGHMATLMATVTILSSNYPDNKYIKPVGYSLMGLLGYSMLNNGVHWISDYPLAIAIGYTCGKIAVSHGRQVITKKLLEHGISSSLTPVYLGQGTMGLSYRWTF